MMVADYNFSDITRARPLILDFGHEWARGRCLLSNPTYKVVRKIEEKLSLNSWLGIFTIGKHHCHSHAGSLWTRMALCLKQVFNKDKTFRPRKKFEPGTQRFELYKKAQASLKSGLDLKAVVQLPPGENINDWIAVHLVDFFNRINLIYGTMSEFCTEKTCPIMSGGPKYEYRWQDDHRFKRPTKLSAPQYMCMLMDWIETLINNEDIFPTRIGIPFPKNFQQVCTKILTRLFRVFVHVYIHHFDSIISMGAEAHVNTCYKHFYYFISEFSLVDQRELEPLKEMTERICH